MVTHSPPTARVPSSHLGHSMWVSWWTKWSLGRFFSGFLLSSPSQISFYYFSILISFIHFIYPCASASGVVGRHPCYSQTFNNGASSHLIPRPMPCVGHEFRITYNLNSSVQMLCLLDQLHHHWFDNHGCSDFYLYKNRTTFRYPVSVIGRCIRGCNYPRLSIQKLCFTPTST